MTDPALDPFQEKQPTPHRRHFFVLGAEFIVNSNELGLLELVDDAFGGLPEHKLASRIPRLTIDLILCEEQSSDIPDALPPLRLQSGAGIIVGAFDSKNYAVISVAQRCALISVSREMLAFPYELRYELLEFAFLTLAPRVQGLVPLHAACVGLGDRGLLLAGQTGAGKSMLSLSCMLRGFDFLAEDGVFVSPDKLLATGCANFVHLHKDALRYVSDVETNEAILASPIIRRRSGAQKFELNVRETRFSLAPIPLQLAALVLISPQPARDELLLTPLSTRDAAEALQADQPYGAGLPQWPWFLKKLASVPAYRLGRAQHPEQAADALRELL